MRTRIAVFVVTFLMWGQTPELSMLGLQPVHALWLNGVAVSTAVSFATTISGLQVGFENGLFISHLLSEHLWNVPSMRAVL